MLKTERNTKTMEARIKRAAKKHFGHNNFYLAFEHGQWWLIGESEDDDPPGHYSYSVIDAEGPGTVDGFSFEELF